MRWLFVSGDQNIVASASVSVFPVNIQDWFSLRLTGLISLLSKGLSGVFSSTTNHSLKATILWRSAFFMVQFSQEYVTTGKTISSVQLLSRVRLFATPWQTVACQAPLSMEFPRQECWSGFPCPSPGDLSDPGIQSSSPAAPELQADSLPLSHWGRPRRHVCSCCC